MILFCLRQREAVLQPTTTGQLWYFGSSFGKLWQFKKKKRYSNKPSQSLHHLEAGCHIEVLVNLHYWCISTVSVFRCLLKELSDLMVANSILMSFQPPSLNPYFTFCFNQSDLLVPISHWWLIWSCSLINKDDLNVFYSQTYNSVAELNLKFFWFLLSVIKPDWHGHRSHNGIAAKMLALILLYVHKGPRGFSPLKVLFRHWIRYPIQIRF